MDPEIKKLLEENLRMTEEIYKISKKVKGYMLFQQVFSFIKIMVIIVPLLLGYYYLQPMISDIIYQYQQMINLSENVKGLETGGININSISPELIKQFLK